MNIPMAKDRIIMYPFLCQVISSVQKLQCSQWYVFVKFTIFTISVPNHVKIFIMSPGFRCHPAISYDFCLNFHCSCILAECQMCIFC